MLSFDVGFESSVCRIAGSSCENSRFIVFDYLIRTGYRSIFDTFKHNSFGARLAGLLLHSTYKEGDGILLRERLDWFYPALEGDEYNLR